MLSCNCPETIFQTLSPLATTCSVTTSGLTAGIGSGGPIGSTGSGGPIGSTLPGSTSGVPALLTLSKALLPISQPAPMAIPVAAVTLAIAFSLDLSCSGANISVASFSAAIKSTTISALPSPSD